jgi:hydrogenase nickel incorporation protein HypA/HybF
LHELSVAQNIVDQVKQILESKKVTRVDALYLKIGSMSGVDSHSLRFVFPEATKGSPLEGCSLHIEEISLKVYCPSCQNEGQLQEFYPYCPTCFSPNVKVLEGEELLIDKMEVL